MKQKRLLPTRKTLNELLFILGVGVVALGFTYVTDAKPNAQSVEHNIRMLQKKGFRKGSHMVRVSDQICNDYVRNCPWDTKARYHVDSVYQRQGEYFARLSNFTGDTASVNFRLLKITDRTIFPSKHHDNVRILRAKYLAPNSLFKKRKQYPYYSKGERVVMLDEVGNQVLIPYIVLGLYKPVIIQ